MVGKAVCLQFCKDRIPQFPILVSDKHGIFMKNQYKIVVCRSGVFKFIVINFRGNILYHLKYILSFAKIWQ